MQRFDATKRDQADCHDAGGRRCRNGCFRTGEGGVESDALHEYRPNLRQQFLRQHADRRIRQLQAPLQQQLSFLLHKLSQSLQFGSAACALQFFTLIRAPFCKILVGRSK